MICNFNQEVLEKNITKYTPLSIAKAAHITFLERDTFL